MDLDSKNQQKKIWCEWYHSFLLSRPHEMVTLGPTPFHCITSCKIPTILQDILLLKLNKLKKNLVMLQLYIAENVPVERLLYHCVLQLYLIRTVTVVSNPFCIEHSILFLHIL